MIDAVLTHLWQSTAVAAVAAAVVLTLRRSSAAARHAFWLAASVKFLVPFPALIALGQLFKWRAVTTAAPVEIGKLFDAGATAVFFRKIAVEPNAVVQAAGPSPWLWTIGALWLAGCVFVVGKWAGQWFRAQRMARRATLAHDGREVAALRDLERGLGWEPAIPLRLIDAAIEPGIFGIVSPVLLWPRGLSERLTDAQLTAIVSHEIGHVRRRDNLSAFVHAMVQAIFWFHPVVWWIGARLMEERERACDEHVLQHGDGPEYAESILKTCRFSIEAAMPCVAGVTGADLTRRIDAIVRHEVGRPLGRWAKRCFGAVAAGALVIPLVVGVLTAPPLMARTRLLRATAQDAPARMRFEVASVKPNTETGAAGPRRINVRPGNRIVVENMSVADLVRFAYQVQSFQMVGGPDWLKDRRFDVNAKAETELTLSPPGTVGPNQLMMRSLLEDRFNLQVHHETREMPIYALVMARADRRFGPGLTESTTDCDARARDMMRGAPPPPSSGKAPVCGFQIMPGRMLGGGFGLGQLAGALAQQLQRIVVDRTGLTGKYDIDLSFTPENVAEKVPGAGDGPSIFTALPEQLGVKLESTRGPVDVLVIDRLDAPTPD